MRFLLDACAASRTLPLRGPLRGGRQRGALLHAPEGEGVLNPAVQPGLERRRRQSTEPGRHQDRLPVARGAGPRKPHQHPGELRPGGGGEGREDRQDEAHASLAPLPSARNRASAARRRRGARGGPALPDPAFGGQRQEQLHRLAGPPTDWARQGRGPDLRLGHRRQRPADSRPADSRPADPRHHQALRPGRSDGGTCRAFRQPAEVHRVRQEDYHLDGPEVPGDPGGDRQRATHAALRDHHRRGPFQPGRPHFGVHVGRARDRRRRRRGRDLRGSDQPRDGVAQAPPPTPATSRSPPPRRTRRWRSSARPTRSPTAPSGTACSTATP